MMIPTPRQVTTKPAIAPISTFLKPPRFGAPRPADCTTSSVCFAAEGRGSGLLVGRLTSVWSCTGAAIGGANAGPTGVASGGEGSGATGLVNGTATGVATGGAMGTGAGGKAIRKVV